MPRLTFALILASLLLTLSPTAASAGEPLCLPGQATNSDCLPHGSAAYFERMAEMGMRLPLQPLAANSTDPGLTALPFYYARVNTANAPIFATPEDAAAGKPVVRVLEAGLVYVTYQDVREIDGKNYYMIGFGEWMRRGDISPNVTYSQFSGLEFAETPQQPFGWVLEYFQARSAPSLSAPMAERFFNGYEVVQVYDIVEADGIKWFMVGPDLWLESRQARLVIPNTTPPEGVDNGRWIEVNLEQQTLTVYQDSEMVFATVIATGLPGVWTRPGLFQVYEKHESTLMRGVFTADRSDYYFLEDVPWTLYFDEARALHGAYWRARLGFEQSHGCVNLSVADSHWVFNWASVGDWVWVHDPSGRTPSDFEGSGGA